MSPSVADSSSALAVDLKAHVSALPHKDLTEKLENARALLASFDARRNALRHALAKAGAACRQREAALLVIDAGADPHKDDDLQALLAKEAELKNGLDLLAPEEAKVRQLGAAIQDELRSRDATLRGQVEQRCRIQWSGKAEPCIQAARRALAEAIVAEAHRRTMHPQQVAVDVFVMGVIDHGEVQKIVQNITSEDLQQARAAILKRDRTLG